MNFLGKILPSEGYYVQINGNLPVDYAISLTHLYQPLIGMEAITLYQTLLHEIDIQPKDSLQTHHTLMNYLNLPLDQIYEARLKLEGIGLLQTYENDGQAVKSYTYVLQSPFSPNDFFKDAMLSELLYHHIGENKFTLLKERFFQEQQKETKGKNITTAFHDVFQTFEPSPNVQQGQPVVEQEVVTHQPSLDFTWMESMLQSRMIDANKVLTVENRKLITDMMLLYDLTSLEIEKAVLWALTEENVLDQEEFKVACHDMFKVKNKQRPIKLVMQRQTTTQPQLEQQVPKTKEEKLIQRLETISPKQLLEDLSNGNQASEQDMKIIRDVMTSQGLPQPVMNVLIHYVLLQSNMRLSKAYMEKIASHWSRANLKTAREAMTFAKKEIEQAQKKAKRRTNYRQPRSNEVIPEWFKERHQKPSKVKTKKNDPKQEQEREKLASLIRQFAEE